jgi:uncharacterized protein
VETLRQYIIHFKGLSLGKHAFEYVIDTGFFEETDIESGIRDGNMKVVIDLDKQERMLALHFSLSGAVVVECDRCLDDLELEIRNEQVLFIKYGAEYLEESENVIIIPEEEHQIDVGQLIMEYIILSLPLHKVHPDDEKGQSTCNRMMLDKLNELSGHKGMDPRWDRLKDLLTDYK